MKLADRGVMRVRLARRIHGVLEQVKFQSPEAVWFGEELVIPGRAANRPALLDLIRNSGGEITGLTAQEGRLDQFYRELVGAAA